MRLHVGRQNAVVGFLECGVAVAEKTGEPGAGRLEQTQPAAVRAVRGVHQVASAVELRDAHRTAPQRLREVARGERDDDGVVPGEHQVDHHDRGEGGPEFGRYERGHLLLL